MSRYIIDTDKHMSQFDGIIMTTVSGLEDADKALDDAYQRGFENGKAQREHDDKIEVGDEVEISQSDENDVWVVTKVEKHDDYEAYCAINKDGDNIYFEEEQDRVTKTGRHFDIKSILEAMKA